jgi:hypothetical protein
MPWWILKRRVLLSVGSKHKQNIERRTPLYDRWKRGKVVVGPMREAGVTRVTRYTRCVVASEPDTSDSGYEKYDAQFFCPLCARYIKLAKQKMSIISFYPIQLHTYRVLSDKNMGPSKMSAYAACLPLVRISFGFGRSSASIYGVNVVWQLLISSLLAAVEVTKVPNSFLDLHSQYN